MNNSSWSYSEFLITLCKWTRDSQFFVSILLFLRYFNYIINVGYLKNWLFLLANDDRPRPIFILSFSSLLLFGSNSTTFFFVMARLPTYAQQKKYNAVIKIILSTSSLIRPSYTIGPRFINRCFSPKKFPKTEFFPYCPYCLPPMLGRQADNNFIDRPTNRALNSRQDK